MRKNTKKSIFKKALAITCCLCFAGITAYFTDADTLTDTFTVGKVSLNCKNLTGQGLEETDLAIVVNSYGIQTTNINDAVGQGNSDGKVASADVWSVVQKSTSSFDTGDSESTNQNVTICAYLVDGNRLVLTTEETLDASYNVTKDYGVMTYNEGESLSNPTSLTNWHASGDYLTIETVEVKDEIYPRDCTAMFIGCENLRTFENINNLNTSNAKNMTMMFYGCVSLTSLDVSGWNVSNVTDMSSMFSYCWSLASLDVEGWDTSNVTNMANMFFDCTSLTTLDLNSWDVGNVTNMNSMFWGCSNLSNIDVSKRNPR